MPPKTKHKDELLIRKDGTVRIAFDQTEIELGQIRTGQLRELKEELDAIQERIRQMAVEDAAAKSDIDTFNAEHEGEDGFEPKEFDPTTVYMDEEYGPWLIKVIETLGTTKERLPEDRELWPPWLSQSTTLNAVMEAWQFNPLVRGDG